MPVPVPAMLTGMQPLPGARLTAMFAGPGTPLCVVFGAASWVSEYLVGFVDVLELQGRTGRVIAIGMIAPSQTAKCGIHPTSAAGAISSTA
jgi:hypothetical protein